MQYLGGAVAGTLGVALVVLSLISTVGLVYITKFSFQGQQMNGSHCVMLTQSQLQLVKMTVVLQWIFLALATLGLFGSIPIVVRKLAQPMVGEGSRLSFKAGLGSVASLGMLGLLILYYYGVAKLTMLAFSSQAQGDMVCVQMSSSDFVVVQIVTVLMWASVFRMLSA